MMCCKPYVFRLLALAAATLLAASCQPSSEDSSAPHELRIVSLSPALTRMVVDLGLGDSLVGRTRYCTSAPQSVPVTGDHFDVDLEALIRVRPTVLLVQPPRNEVPQALRDLAVARGWELLHWKMDSLSDVRRVLSELASEIAQRAPDGPDIRLRAQQLDERIAEATSRDASGLWTGRVLVVHSVEPRIGVFGRGTYLDELINALGCTNAAGNLNGWVQLSLEDVVRIAPEAIVVLRAGNPADSIREGLGPLISLGVPAIDTGRVAAISWDDAVLPSTSLIATAGELREILEAFSNAGG